MIPIGCLFPSRGAALAAAATMPRDVVCTGPEPVATSAARPWLLVVSLRPERDGAVSAADLAQLRRTVAYEGGEIDARRLDDPDASVNRLATPLPASVLDRFHAENPQLRNDRPEHPSDEQDALF